MNPCIVVLQRGWVLIGDMREDQPGHYTMTRAHVVRRWGTHLGLGQLGRSGPTSQTILDLCPPVHFTDQMVIFVMDCNPDVWAGKLDG